MAQFGAPIDPPFSDAELKRLRLDLRRHVPTRDLGAHLRRRMGQSLEFKEFRDYAMGDDIRKVDWLASARRGRPNERIVRAFEAEDRMTLAVAIDCRPAMYLPEGAEKIRIAIWIAQCLMHAALAEGDRIVVGTLFGQEAWARPLQVRGPAGMQAARRLFSDLLARHPTEAEWLSTPPANPGHFLKQMQPASAVAVISDMLFLDTDGAMKALARHAQRDYRTLSVVEIDAWPSERAMISTGPFSLGGMEGREFDNSVHESTERMLVETEAALQRHRDDLRRAWKGPGLIWPEPPLRYPQEARLSPDGAAIWFRRSFPKGAFLPGLMSRAA